MALTLNTGHALYGNLLCLICVDPDADTVVDLVTPARTFTVAGGATIGAAGTYGKSIKTAGSGYSPAGVTLNTAVDLTSATIGEALSVVLVANQISAPSNSYSVYPILSNSSGSHKVLSPYVNTTETRLKYDATLSAASTAYKSGDGAVSIIGARGPNSHALYINGASVVSAATGISATSSLIEFGIIGGRSGQSVCPGQYVWIAYFDRELTSTEASDLHNSLGADQAFALVSSASPATSIGIAGPASGLTSAASTNFTLTANNSVSGAVTLTPASTLAGTFSPETPVIADGTDSITFTFTPTVAGAHSITLTNDGSLSNPSAHAYTVTDPDAIAPVLSDAAVSAIAATTATLAVDTDEGNGTLYAIASTSATPPSVGQIQAGQDNSGSASAYAGNMSIGTTGTKQFSAAGLSASTTYYAHFQHTDSSSNDSTVLTSASFDTAAPNNPPTFPGPNIGNQTGQDSVAFASVDVSGSFADVDAMTFSAIGTWPAGVTVSSAGVISGVPSAQGSYTGLQVRATDTAAQSEYSDTFSFTISAPPPPGTITLLPCEMDNGTTLASTTLRAVQVYDVADNHLVTFHDVALNSSGTATINDASIVTGGNYDVDIVRNDLTSSPGRRRYTAS